MSKKTSFFPAKIQYTTSKSVEVVNHPEDIRSGEGFIVLELNVATISNKES